MSTTRGAASALSNITTPPVETQIVNLTAKQKPGRQLIVIDESSKLFKPATIPVNKSVATRKFIHEEKNDKKFLLTVLQSLQSSDQLLKEDKSAYEVEKTDFFVRKLKNQASLRPKTAATIEISTPKIFAQKSALAMSRKVRKTKLLNP